MNIVTSDYNPIRVLFYYFYVKEEINVNLNT